MHAATPFKFMGATEISERCTWFLLGSPIDFEMSSSNREWGTWDPVLIFSGGPRSQTPIDYTVAHGPASLMVLGTGSPERSSTSTFFHISLRI